jgi:hypothetical protein
MAKPFSGVVFREQRNFLFLTWCAKASMQKTLT